MSEIPHHDSGSPMTQQTPLGIIAFDQRKPAGRDWIQFVLRSNKKKKNPDSRIGGGAGKGKTNLGSFLHLIEDVLVCLLREAARLSTSSVISEAITQELGSVVEGIAKGFMYTL